MSWTSGNTFPRKNGLIIGEASAAPPALGLTLRPTFASMDFAAAYLADFPGAVELAATFSAPDTGANCTLSAGNLNTVFAGTATTRVSSVDVGVTFGTAWEVQLNAANAFGACGVYNTDIGVYGAALYSGGHPAGSILYDALTGAWSDGQGQAGVGPALAVGDVVGFVFNGFAFPSSTQCRVYVNGVAVFDGGVVDKNTGVFAMLTQA